MRERDLLRPYDDVLVLDQRVRHMRRASPVCGRCGIAHAWMQIRESERSRDEAAAFDRIWLDAGGG